MAIFQANAQITYPILMFGAQAGIMTDYDCTYDLFFVIGADGIILYRGPLTVYDETAIRAAIDQGIADLSAPSPVADTPGLINHLRNGYPNPFNPSTRIPYELGGGPGTVAVRLDILDIRGRVVRTLVNALQEAGQVHEAVWNGIDLAGRKVPSGTYISRLTVDGEQQSRLLTLVK